MPGTIPAIVMLPPHGDSSIERWVARGRLAAAHDLIVRLIGSNRFAPILVVAADQDDEGELAQLGVKPWRSETNPFHFGGVLSECIAENQLPRVAYFGGASAPLLDEIALTELADRMIHAGFPTALTNNLHSSDWFLTNDVEALHNFKDRFPSDNPVGWVLSEEAGIQVIGEAPSAATRLDIDTPMDFAMVVGHRSVGPELERFTQSLPADILDRVMAIKELLSARAKCLMVLGRASAHLWQQLETRTQIWVRMLAEERGMVASQRLAHGDVRSLAAEMIRVMGAQEFVNLLAGLSDGAIWDTRVWMAAEIGWPSAQDRFASDLGRVDEIMDPVLRELTRAIHGGSIPILAGGYGVVSGGLYALLESIPSS